MCTVFQAVKKILSFLTCQPVLFRFKFIFLAFALHINPFERLLNKFVIGGNMRNGVSLLIIVASFFVTASFQNCGQGQFTNSTNQIADGISQTADQNTNVEREQVIDQGSSYSQIVYRKTSEKFDRTGPVGTVSTIDLSNGSMTHVKTTDYNSTPVAGSSLSCQIDAVRLKALSNLLASSRICQSAADLQNDLVTCAAIAVSDLQLINQTSGEKIELRANVCNSGVFLCEGLDQKFRQLLADIAQNLPAACQPSVTVVLEN